MKFDNRASSLSSTGKIFSWGPFFLEAILNIIFIFLYYFYYIQTQPIIFIFISLFFVAYFWMHHSKFILTSRWKSGHPQIHLEVFSVLHLKKVQFFSWDSGLFYDFMDVKASYPNHYNYHHHQLLCVSQSQSIRGLFWDQKSGGYFSEVLLLLLLNSALLVVSWLFDWYPWYCSWYNWLSL